MNDHRSLLRNWLAKCDPNEPIGFCDERYCELKVNVEDHSIWLRGKDAMAPLADCIELSDASCQLFSGYSGNGKSTELRRLVYDLRGRDYVVLHADAEAYHDLQHPIVLSEFLVLVAAAFGREVAIATNGDIPHDNYWERFVGFLNREVDLGSAKLSGGGAELSLALRHATPFWLEVRRSLESCIARLKEDVHSFIQECLELLAKRGQSRVVFILDSLEKLSGPLTEVGAILESVVQVFSQHSDLLRLPGCHVIYTIPPYVELLAQSMVRLYDGRMHVLPSIKVLERGEEIRAYEPGVSVMVELVAKRIPIDQVFAQPDLVRDLVLASAGHVRTLIYLLRELLVGAASNGLPIQRIHVDTVIAGLREQLELAIRPEAVLILDGIRRSGTQESVSTPELAQLSRHVLAQVVLCYRNGEGWYEVHPLVREHVRHRAERLLAGSSQHSPAPS